MRSVFITLSLIALTACSSAPINGDVAKACIAADRSAASPQLCSCVQQAANRTLSASDQALAARFFAEPQLAQDTRQSDNRNSEAFWDRYKLFSQTARQICR